MPFAEPPAPPAPSTLAEVDAALEGLFAQRDAWRAVPTSERAKLLDACVVSIAAAAERWVEIGARIKGIAPDADLAGEEWVAGVLPSIRNARLLADAMREGGRPTPPVVRTRPDGRVVARVHPRGFLEKQLFRGITADVWIQRDKRPTQGAAYRRDAAREGGRVCLVLGGGNVSSIPAMDALYKLFVDDEVVLLKMNPVNAALAPVLADALRPLVDRGVLAIVTGGADVGAHAASHPRVGSLHVTGSDRTYDAIVWGAEGGESVAERKARGERRNERPFTAELGCVTPVLVVPGPWSSRDIRFQARHVASMVTQNASFNCNAAKVLVTARGWLQREAFLDALHEELRRTPPRKAYYPGADARHRAFLDAYPGALILGAREEEAVPWTAIPDVPETPGHALREEAFCGILAEVTLDVADDRDGLRRERDPGGPSPARFLERAVAFANERCWGTLSCALLVHPASEESPEVAQALARALEELRYGAIGVNAWPGLIYALASPSWGAFPGHTPEAIGSGTGVVHDAFLFDHPEKSVVRAPFRAFPTPPWFSDHRNLVGLGRALVSYEARPSFGALLGVVRAAVRG